MRVYCSRGAFILGFMDGIPDGQLNITIFRYLVSDFICQVKLKFSIRTQNFKNPSRFFNYICYFVSQIVNN